MALRLFRKWFPERATSRVVCQHFHIFKNAGSTVDWALKRWFRRAFIAHDGSNAGTVLSGDYVARFLCEHPEVEAFSSHQARPEWHRRDAGGTDDTLTVLPMIFLRHPIDRAGSVYSFQRRHPRDVAGVRQARDGGLAKYIQWWLRLSPANILANFQVTYCAGVADLNRPQVTEAHLELAKKGLQSCPIVAVVERLDEGLVVAETILDPYFPGIDLSYVRQNVSTERNADLAERLAVMAEQLGEPLMSELTQRNLLDVELHRVAGQMLDRTIAGVPSFALRLAGFRSRCRRIQRRYDSSLRQRFRKWLRRDAA